MLQNSNMRAKTEFSMKDFSEVCVRADRCAAGLHGPRSPARDTTTHTQRETEPEKSISDEPQSCVTGEFMSSEVIPIKHFRNTSAERQPMDSLRYLWVCFSSSQTHNKTHFTPVAFTSTGSRKHMSWRSSLRFQI